MVESDQMVIIKWRQRVIGTLTLVIICVVAASLLSTTHSFSGQTILDLQSLVTLSTLIHAVFIGILANSLYKNAIVAFGAGVFTLVLSFFIAGIGMFLFTIFVLYKSKIILEEK